MLHEFLFFLYVTGIAFGYSMALHGRYKRIKKKLTKCAAFFQEKPEKKFWNSTVG
jgi:hypothetical protein